MAGCRDCPRCLESSLIGCLMAPIRLTLFLLGGFLLRATQQLCPQCGHRMAIHQRRQDGSLKD